MTAKKIHEVLLRAGTSPQEEYAGEPEAPRAGVYRLTAPERDAIDRARRGDYVPDREMEAYRNHHGIK
jgi:hypothetical protein